LQSAERYESAKKIVSDRIVSEFGFLPAKGKMDVYDYESKLNGGVLLPVNFEANFDIRLADAMSAERLRME
jgi:hypothetical protein